MKRIALSLGVLFAALPLWHTMAAKPTVSPANRVIPISFSIVPGKPLLPGAPLPTRQTPRYFQLSTAPGASNSDWVAVVNPSTTPLSVKMGVSDVFTQPQGGGRAFNDVGPERNVGRWVSLASEGSVVTIPPRSARLIGMSIHVPTSVEPGEYEGTINGTNQQINAVQIGKRIVRLQGTVRCIVYMRVTGPASVGVEISKVAVAHAQGHTLLTMVIENKGTIIARTSVLTVTFKGRAIHQPYIFQAPIGSIMGKAAATMAFAIDHGVPSGAYTVTVRIDYQAQIAETGPLRAKQGTWSGSLVVTQGAGS